LAEKLREYLGQPFIVVDKPGPSGAVAISYVTTSRPDGYNIFAAAGTSAGYLHLTNPSFGYSFRDFLPVAAFARYPQVIIVSKELPVKNLADLAAYIKKNPKALSYGGVGYGGGDHLAFEMFKAAAGIPQADVPLIAYNGAAPTVSAVAGNQTQIGCLAYSAVIGKQIQAGTVRALAVLSSKRFKFLPAVPTVVEQGFPDMVIQHYFSHWVPAKTPAAVIKKLEGAVKKATDDKEVREKIERMEIEVEFLSSSDLEKYAEDQVATQFGPLIRKLGITIK